LSGSQKQAAGFTGGIWLIRRNLKMRKTVKIKYVDFGKFGEASTAGDIVTIDNCFNQGY
jgi:hypothetical protein